MSELRNSDRMRDGWATLAAQAQRAAPSTPGTLPAGFVERVLAGRAAGPVSLARPAFERTSDERFIAWTACLALAASLVLVLWNWPELEVAWTGPPAVADAWVQVEPWL
jgi:hypothetical protein